MAGAVHSDLSASATVLQRLTGSAPAAFAFPYGSLDGANNDPRIPAQLTEQLADEGFVTAFLSGDATSTGPSPNPAEPGDQPWSIPCIGMVASTSVDQMLDLLSGMAPVPVGIPADEQMVADGGTCTHLGGAVRLSVGGGYASCRSMRNTWSWRNYVVDADLGCPVRLQRRDLGARCQPSGSAVPDGGLDRVKSGGPARRRRRHRHRARSHRVAAGAPGAISASKRPAPRCTSCSARPS